MKRRFVILCYAALFLLPAAADAQPPVQRDAQRAGPVQLQVVIARYRSEKKVAEMPYMLSVKTTGDQPRGGQLRIGSQIPISTTVDGKPTVIFRDIGMGIDAQASVLEDGRYAVSLNIDETAVYAASQEPFKLQVVAPAPVLRLYRASNTMFMKEGQTSQFTAGTDPMTGDTVRVDVTLTVPK